MQEATGQMKDANNVLGIEEYSLDVKSTTTAIPTKSRHYL